MTNQINSHKTMQSTFGDKLENIKEINFDDGQIMVVVNAKLFLDIIEDTANLASQIENIKSNLKYLEQEIYNLLEKKKRFF